MKTEKELQRDILAITMKIDKECPELSKYLIEIPIPFSESDSNGINQHNLEDYYHTLETLLKSYLEEHLKMDDLKLNKVRE